MYEPILVYPISYGVFKVVLLAFEGLVYISFTILPLNYGNTMSYLPNRLFINTYVKSLEES